MLITLFAWACALWAPRTTVSQTLQILIFGGLGALFALAGGFSWWWDSGMRPDQRSAVVLVCGVLTLGITGWVWLRAAAEDEFGR